MFITLLIIKFVIALLVSLLTVLVFRKAIHKILKRLVSEDIFTAWSRYILFAIFVVGIAGGINLWQIDRYITPDDKGNILQLTQERWVLEIYRSVIDTLVSIAWLLMVFFVFALIAFVIVKGIELRRQDREQKPAKK
jgi:hypothetical protein